MDNIGPLLILYFETRSYHVNQSGLKLGDLPLPPEVRDETYTPPSLENHAVLKRAEVVSNHTILF